MYKIFKKLYQIYDLGFQKDYTFYKLVLYWQRENDYECL